MSYYPSISFLIDNEKREKFTEEKEYLKSLLYSWKRFPPPSGVPPFEDQIEEFLVERTTTYSFRELFGMLEILTLKTECFELGRGYSLEEVLGSFEALNTSLTPALSKDDALCVNIHYGYPNKKDFLDEDHALSETPWVLRFTSTPFSFPRNRLTKKFGSDNFLVVTLNLPPIHLDDICNDILPSKTLRTHVMNQVLNDLKLISKLKTKTMNQFDEEIQFFNIAKSVREYVYKHAFENIVEKFKKLTILGKDFEFFACNTTGALTGKFIYVNSSIMDNVKKWCVPINTFNLENVFKKDQPLKLPIRYSLMNTTCIETICMDKNWVSDIEDIQSNEFVMTDGCGYVTDRDLWNEILEKYRINWKTYSNDIEKQYQQVQNLTSIQANASNLSIVDSINNYSISEDLINIDNQTPYMLQIRYNGYKGMLVFFPELPTKELGKKIFLPKSMKKIECDINDPILNNLCIVGVSYNRPVMLSREIIIMLCEICTDRKKLLEYLRRYLFEERIDLNNNNISSIKNQKTIENLLKRRHDDEGLNRIKKSNNFDMFDIFTGTKTFQNYILTLNVPLPNSAYMYGGADWTQSLEEGEVFLRINGKTITGNILIAKTPILFPNDARMFKAVDRTISNADNILLFSTKGSVFGPSLTSNADLDGDHFHLMWDSKLLEIIEVIQHRPSISNTSNTGFDDNCITNDDINSDESDTLLELLIKPAKSRDHCTFNHLIEIYRRYIDKMDTNWARDDSNCKTICEIAQVLTDTFDAPKHSVWRKWTNSLKEIIANVPEFPHFDSFFSKSRKSTSIYGTLYEELLTKLTGDNNLSCFSLKESIDLCMGIVMGNSQNTSIRDSVHSLYDSKKNCCTKESLLIISSLTSIFHRELLDNISFYDIHEITDGLLNSNLDQSKEKIIRFFTEREDPEDQFLPSYNIFNDFKSFLILDKIDNIDKWYSLLETIVHYNMRTPCNYSQALTFLENHSGLFTISKCSEMHKEFLSIIEETVRKDITYLTSSSSKMSEEMQNRLLAFKMFVEYLRIEGDCEDEYEEFCKNCLTSVFKIALCPKKKISEDLRNRNFNMVE